MNKIEVISGPPPARGTGGALPRQGVAVAPRAAAAPELFGEDDA